MEQIISYLQNSFLDMLFYGLTLLVFLLGVFKCSLPVFRNASILRRASEMLEEGAKAKLARPVWSDQDFLGKKLQPVWRGFLQNAEMMASRGISCDVADYIHEDSMILIPGKLALADIIPGFCTSLGILGTFVGLSNGLKGLDVMQIDSYIQLTSGISFAFNTSIVGIIASLIFNVTYKHAAGRARSAMTAFEKAFYTYGIAKPADADMQIIAYEREQADAIGRFTAELGSNIAGEIHHALVSAMAPMQHSMDNFMNTAAKAQVEGLDLIITRFIDRMNTAMEGQMHRLAETISQTADDQIRVQMDLREAVSAVTDLSQSVVNLHGISEQIINKFATFVGNMESAYQSVGNTQTETADLLEEISQASLRQARYLSALQEYQAKLQASFQDYTLWTDRFIGGLEQRTAAQSEALEEVAGEMRSSADLLRGSYKSFVESIELGLANALGLFDENMQNLTRQIHATLSDVKETMMSLETSLSQATSKAAKNKEVS